MHCRIAGVLLLGSSVALAASAEPPARFFDSPWIGYNTGPWPEAIYPYDAVVGDFNGDSVPDLAAVSFLVGWPSLSIMLGDGHGGYLPPTVHATAVECAGVAALDWDNDGDLDLAVTDTDRFFGGFAVSLWENDGNGNFNWYNFFDVGDTGPAGIIAADFDGDGWMDIATANDESIECNNTVSVLLNRNGTGFGPAAVYTIGGCPSEIDAGDLDGDGHVDLVVGHHSNRWSILLNDGEGGFTDAGFRVGIPSGSLPENPTIHLADIDLDQDLDVLYAHQDSGGIGAGAVGLWRNNGDGDFAPAETLSFEWYNHGAVDVTTGDVTGDGWPDVLAVTGQEGNWFLFESDGTGDFASPRRLRAGHRPNAVVLSDLDVDGDLDVTVLAAWSIDACVYRNPGDGSFEQPTPLDFCNPNIAPAFTTNVESGDVDGDGDLDLVTGFRSDFTSTHGLTLRRNLGDGTFGPLETYNEAAYPAWLQLADMDGDDDLDLLWFDANTRFHIRWNDGNGGFNQKSTHHAFSISPENMQIRVADVDGDGDLDVGANTGFFFRVSRNLGNRSFSSPYIAVELGEFAQCFAFGDMNEDGHIDLLTSSGATGANVLLCFGLGNGMFNSPVNIGTAERDIHSIGVADLDHDGHLDITVICDRTPKQLTIRRGRGDGNFFLMERHDASFFFNQYTPGGTTELVDVTGDGFEDILFANTDAQDFSLWVNNGDGTFADAVRYGAGHNVYDMAAGDFNDDGRIDIAMSAGVDAGQWSYVGVVIIEGVDPEAQEPMSAPLGDFSLIFGSLVSGTLNDLRDSDDAYLRVRSQFGFSATTANILQLQSGFTSPLAAPTSMNLSVESRVNQPNGLGHISIRNWQTSQLQPVASYPITMTDSVVEVNDIDATNFVRPGDERIETSLRMTMIATFTPLGFDAHIDHLHAAVRE